MYIGMVNNASIDWYFPWPEQALFAVASVLISPDVCISVKFVKVFCVFVRFSFVARHTLKFCCVECVNSGGVS